MNVLKRLKYRRALLLMATAITAAGHTLNAAPPELKTSGNRIVKKATPTDQVRLTGASLPSLEWGNGENLTGSANHIINTWKGNVIRLPIKETRWLNSTSYQATVDAMVNQAAAANIYIILDNHEYARPTANTIPFWNSVANRPLYKNNPAVIFGLMNEPHGISWDIWKDGDATGPGLQAVLDAVRATGANNMVLVGGPNYASNVTGWLNGTHFLTDTASGNGIIYDVHIYPWHQWDSWTRLARTHPLLIGECGHDGTTTGGTGTNFGGNSPFHYWQILGVADALGASYTPWAFHLSAGPKMIEDNTAYSPTPSAGAFVLSHLNSVRSTAHESKVLNPSFEAPVISSHVYRPSGANWTFAGNAGIQKTWNPAVQGTQTAFLQSATATDSGQNGVAGSMTQTVAFDLPGTYVVNLLLAQRSGKTELPIKISIDGVPISSVNYTPGDALGDNQFMAVVSAPFTVNSGGNHVIKLEAAAPSGVAADALIDSITITMTPSAIIKNGGFQMGDKASGALSSGQFRYRPSGSDWTFTGNSGIEYSALGAPVAPEGRFPRAAFLQTAVGSDSGGQGGVNANGQNGAFTANVEFAAPGAYSINFQAATRTGKGNLGIRVLVDGVLVGTVTPTTTTWASYATPAFNIHTPGYHAVTLEATPSSTADNQAFIDVVKVTVPTASYTRQTPVLIGNAGFESPSHTSASAFLAPTGTPWTYTGKISVTSDVGSTRNYDGKHATEGWQKLSFQGDGVNLTSASQVVSFSSAGTYAIHFQAQRGRNGVVPLTIYVNGAVVGTHTPPSKAFYPYTTAPFTVTAGNHTIRLESPSTTTSTGSFTLVDAVNIYRIPAAGPTEIILDAGHTNTSGVQVVGTWISSGSTSGSYNYSYLHDNNDLKGTKSVIYTPDLPVSGSYNVYARWASHSNRPDDVPIDINYAGGSEEVEVNQKTGGGVWVLLGTYPFNAGTGGNVVISNAETSGFVIADAIRFELD